MTSLNRRTFVASSALLALAGTRLAGARDATPSASGSISVEGVMGTLELDRAPERVVALEWDLTENLLALGVQPVGIADLDGYRDWVSVPLELSDDVADVGGRLEPSLEAIAALDPDLILTIENRQEPIHDALAEIAPTFMLPVDVPHDEVPPLDANFDAFRLLAEAIGRPERAEPVIEEVRQTISNGASRIEKAGMAGAPYVVVLGYTTENLPTMRIATDESQLGQTISEIGLTNAWPGEGDQYGSDVISVEGLLEIADASFFYVVQDTDNIFEEQLAEDPIWNSLAFVQEGRTYALGGDTWIYGGPRSIEVIVERTLTAFLGDAAS